MTQLAMFDGWEGKPRRRRLVKLTEREASVLADARKRPHLDLSDLAPSAVLRQLWLKGAVDRRAASDGSWTYHRKGN